MARETPFDPKPFVKSLTHRPGVYRMLNAKNKIIYVGKAGDLKKRVSSYFQKTATDVKTASMTSQVANVEVTVTNTEAEALILEYNLIKRHRPRFNVVLRDDKSYPYIYASTEHAFPRLRFHRGARKGKGRYFGPYPSTKAVRKTLNELQKLFMLRNCSENFFRNRTRPCLQYQIKRCTGPCVGLISKEDYGADAGAAMMFLEGKNRSVINTLVARMESAAAGQEYEQAARFRDQISRLKKVEAEQLISRNSSGDLDVLGLSSDGRAHCATVLFIRGGKVQGSQNHFPRTAGDATADVLLSGFVSQYYLGREAPGEIIVETDFADRKLLEAELTERSNHRVRIRCRVRGDRQRWLQLAQTNATQGLRIQAASNATLRRQFTALAEVLDLESAPERLECFDVSHTSWRGNGCVLRGLQPGRSIEE